MWGRVTSGTMTEGGVLTEIIVATSADGAVTMRLALGTEVLDCEGELVEVIRVDPIEPPPPPLPPDGHIIAAYDIEPCATFDPPVDLVLEYDDEALPEGVVEQNLVIAFYSEDIGEWVVVMPSVVDTFANTVTARITHTTVFAILGAVPAAEFTLTNLAISPGEVSPGEDVTITVLVTNTGGSTGSITLELRIAGVVQATGGATLAPGASDTVAFTVSRDETGTYGVTVDGLTGSFRVTEAAFPWWAVWLGVGLGAFLLIWIGYFWWRRARA